MPRHRDINRAIANRGRSRRMFDRCIKVCRGLSMQISCKCNLVTISQLKEVDERHDAKAAKVKRQGKKGTAKTRSREDSHAGCQQI